MLVCLVRYHRFCATKHRVAVVTRGSSAAGTMASRGMSTDKQATVAFTKEIETHNRELGSPINPGCVFLCKERYRVVNTA